VRHTASTAPLILVST